MRGSSLGLFSLPTHVSFVVWFFVIAVKSVGLPLSRRLRETNARARIRVLEIHWSRQSITVFNCTSISPRFSLASSGWSSCPSIRALKTALSSGIWL